jgi:hypothetical protein
MITRNEVVLKYIKENPDCTKTNVINYMDRKDRKGKLPPISYSPAPTHKMLSRLIEENKVLCTKDRSNNRVHRLRINESHVFNLVYRNLTEIETVVFSMDKPLNQIFENLPGEENEITRIMKYH